MENDGYSLLEYKGYSLSVIRYWSERNQIDFYISLMIEICDQISSRY
ncbi:hypothetical protein D1AOALGA4SA_10643 [Olavius algarvensis Delta 1 endosymbiont]|nr:hypothetical protein D1AOALGA4SA_10643 [Olavius algarvensis Delta 1 endosymbiont]